MKKRDEDKTVWELILESHRNHNQSIEEDIADSIALAVICGLLLFVVFI